MLRTVVLQRPDMYSGSEVGIGDWCIPRTHLVAHVCAVVRCAVCDSPRIGRVSNTQTNLAEQETTSDLVLEPVVCHVRTGRR